jgi:hypothetical protein
MMFEVLVFRLGKSYTHGCIGFDMYMDVSLSERAMRSRVGEGCFRSEYSAFLSRFELVGLRRRALRCGVWFRVLSRIERSLVDLAIAAVSRVRSLVLARSLAFVVEKLSGFFGSGVGRQVQAVGFPLARRLSCIAQKWGNASAVCWGCDFGFAVFLAVCFVGVVG